MIGLLTAYTNTIDEYSVLLNVIFDKGYHLVVKEDHFELVTACRCAGDDDSSCQITIRDRQPEEVCVLAFHCSTYGLTPNQLLDGR